MQWYLELCIAFGLQSGLSKAIHGRYVYVNLSILLETIFFYLSAGPLRWRHNDRDGVSNHQPHDCLLNRLFRRRSKLTSKLCITGLCVGNSPGPVNSPHKGPITRKMFPFDDVIMHVVAWGVEGCNHDSYWHRWRQWSRLGDCLCTAMSNRSRQCKLLTS